MGRDRPYDLLRKISMRIKESHAFPLRNILWHQRLKECRLSRPGPTDDVHVGEAVRLLNAKRDPQVSKGGLA